MPKETKEEAVTLVTEKGYTILKVAKALGVVKSILYQWKEVVQKKNVDITLLEDEQAQFKSLCKEEKTIRLEKKILKKFRVKSSDQFNMAFNYISWIVLRPVIY